MNVFLSFIALSLVISSSLTPTAIPHLRFSKVGDSITDNAAFLTAFDEKGYYDLDEYQYLQSAVDAYSGSFSRKSLAAKYGWSSLGVVAPNLSDKSVCESWETPLECEYRIWQPSVAIVMIGTNDAANNARLDDFETNINLIIDISRKRGIFVILSTIPPSSKFDVTNYNNVIRHIAEYRHVDLLDYWFVLETMVPNSGIGEDGIHPNWGPMQSGDLGSSSGMTIRNHLVLDELYRLMEFTNANSSGS